MRIVKVTATIVLYVVVFDVIGVVVSFVLDVLPLLGKSIIAFYAIWFVLGVFCGLLAYNHAGALITPDAGGDWTSRGGAIRTGRLVTATSLTLMLVIVIASYMSSSPHTVEESYFVPDNAPLTITFVAGIAASTILAHVALLPAPMDQARSG